MPACRSRFVRNWCHDQAFLGTPLVAAGEEEAFWARGRSPRSTPPTGRPISSTCAAWPKSGPVHRGLAAAARGAIVHREAARLPRQRSRSAGLLRARGPPEEAQGAPPPQEPARRARHGRGAHRSTTRRARRPGATPSSRSRRPAGRARRGARSPATGASERFFRDAGPRRLRGRAAPVPPPRPRRARRSRCWSISSRPPGSFSFKTVFDEDYRPLLAGRADPARESRHPRPIRHRLDGQLRDARTIR